MSLENYNYYNDPRSYSRLVKPPTVQNEDGEEIALPTKKAVCDLCDGTGSYVNPSLDSGGITTTEMQELGDEFFEFYMSPAAQVKCRQCDGERVIPVIDEEACDKDLLESYWDEQDAIASCEAESRAERAMGC